MRSAISNSEEEDMVTVSMERRGVVTVRCTGDRAHKCGADPAEDRVTYTARLWFRPESLDARGFYVDPMEVHAAMERVTDIGSEPFPSCEVLALRAVRALGSLTKAITRVRLTLASGGGEIVPLAGITADWQRDGAEVLRG